MHRADITIWNDAILTVVAKSTTQFYSDCICMTNTHYYSQLTLTLLRCFRHMHTIILEGIRAFGWLTIAAAVSHWEHFAFKSLHHETLTTSKQGHRLNEHTTSDSRSDATLLDIAITCEVL